MSAILRAILFPVAAVKDTYSYCKNVVSTYNPFPSVVYEPTTVVQVAPLPVDNELQAALAPVEPTEDITVDFVLVDAVDAVPPPAESSRDGVTPGHDKPAVQSSSEEPVAASTERGVTALSPFAENTPEVSTNAVGVEATEEALVEMDPVVAVAATALAHGGDKGADEASEASASGARVDRSTADALEATDRAAVIPPSNESAEHVIEGVLEVTPNEDSADDSDNEEPPVERTAVVMEPLTGVPEENAAQPSGGAADIGHVLASPASSVSMASTVSTIIEEQDLTWERTSVVMLHVNGEEWISERFSRTGRKHYTAMQAIYTDRERYEGHPVFVIVQEMDRWTRRALQQKLFETCHVAGVFFCEHAVAAVHSAGVMHTGLVIELGEFGVRVVPVYASHVMTPSVTWSDEYSEARIDQLIAVCDRDGWRALMPTTDGRFNGQDIPRDSLHRHYQEQLRVSAGRFNEEINNITRERQPLEVLFGAQFNHAGIFQGYKDRGLASLILMSLASIPPELRRLMLGNVVVTGSLAGLPRFAERLEYEMKESARLTRDYADAPIHVQAVSAVPFAGARSIVTQAGEALNKMFATREDYDVESSSCDVRFF